MIPLGNSELTWVLAVEPVRHVSEAGETLHEETEFDARVRAMWIRPIVRAWHRHLDEDSWVSDLVRDVADYRRRISIRDRLPRLSREELWFRANEIARDLPILGEEALESYILISVLVDAEIDYWEL